MILVNGIMRGLEMGIRSVGFSLVTLSWKSWGKKAIACGT